MSTYSNNPNESVIIGDEAVEGIALDTYSEGVWSPGTAEVVRELPLALYLNGEELVTILCTPQKLNCLVLGFLYLEGIIEDIGEVSYMRVCLEESLAEIRLSHGYTPPEKAILTSGCGGGRSFTKGLEGIRPLDSDLVIEPGALLKAMSQMLKAAALYRRCGGVHTSALSNGKDLVAVGEDVGRHNTIDKLQGECMLTGRSTKDMLLVTTGRLSSEMLLKAARMETPVVVSRSSPTDRAISLAREQGITLVGYARGQRFSVYAHGERLQV
ncbi:formate dehydrogenase accessory sulfurtransferase FdhD [Chloroflexota bacterium]